MFSPQRASLQLAMVLVVFGVGCQDQPNESERLVIRCLNPFSGEEISCDISDTSSGPDRPETTVATSGSDKTGDDTGDEINSEEEDIGNSDTNNGGNGLNNGANSGADAVDDESSTATPVAVTGSLALSLSDSEPGRLFVRNSATDSYWLKCVSAEIADQSVCVAQVIDNEFEMQCDFKNRSFGCFVMHGNGENHSDLEILGILTSDDLLIGPNTTNARLAITFDPKTGAVSADLSQNTVDENGEFAEVELSTLTKTVPSPLQSLNIADGTYRFCFQEMSDRTSAALGEGTILGDKCVGHENSFYIDFTAAGADTFPLLEIWNTKADRDQCTGADGKLLFHLSDGTNELTFGEGELTYHGESGLLNAIVDYAWAPASAIESYEAAASMQHRDDTFVETLVSHYPSQDYEGGTCSGIIADLKKAWAKGSVKRADDGKRYCMIPHNAYPKPEIAGFEPPAWCVDWKLAKADQRKELENRYLFDCRGFVENDNVEQMWAGHDLVRQFLSRLAETRHQGGENKYRAFTESYNSLTKAMADETIGGSSHDPVDTPMGDLSELSDYDDQIAAFAKHWAEAEWEHNRQQALLCVAQSIGTHTAEGGCNGLLSGKVLDQFPNYRSMFWFLVKSKNPWDRKSPLGYEWIEQQVCAQEGGPLQLANSAQSDIETFMNLAELDEDTQRWVFKSKVSDNARIAAWKSLLKKLIDKKHVTGCSLKAVEYMQQDIADFEENGTFSDWNPVVDFLNWRGLEFDEWLSNKALASLDKTKSLHELATDTMQLALQQKRYLHLAERVCHHYDIKNQWFNFMHNGDAEIKISCGAPVPQPLRPYVHWCSQDTNTCKFPKTNSDQSWTSDERRDSLKSEIAKNAATVDFRNEDAFREKMALLTRHSRCMPDATLGHHPVYQDDISTFEVLVRAPVKRRLSSRVFLDLNQTETGKARLAAREERLEKNDGGLKENACYWGERRLMTGMLHDSDADVLSGVKTSGFIDTCSGDSETEKDYVWYESFKATLNDD